MGINRIETSFEMTPAETKHALGIQLSFCLQVLELSSGFTNIFTAHADFIVITIMMMSLCLLHLGHELLVLAVKDLHFLIRCQIWLSGWLDLLKCCLCFGIMRDDLSYDAIC